MRLRQIPVPSLDGRLCLVTGAASGIGRATAMAAAQAGARLVITDVNQQGLDTTARDIGAAVVTAEALDITEIDAVRALADEVHAQHGAVDVAMNIAGIATWGAVDALTHEHWRRTIDVNLMGPIHVIECFVPEMARSGRGGQLVNVASAAALIGMPWHAPYSATKYGLRGVSEVLRFDLRRHRIGVTLVCPGGVATPIVDSVQVAGIDREAMRRSGVTKRFLAHAKKPEDVAQRILRGITHNRYLVYTSADIRALHLLERTAQPVYVALMRGANRAAVRQFARMRWARGGSGRA